MFTPLPAPEAAAMILLALRRDLFSNEQSKPNYFDNYEYLSTHADTVLFMNPVSMETVKMPLGAPAKEAGII